jgi:hypothetical protein
MRTRRRCSVTGGALALAVVIVPGAQAARPDLRVTSVSQPPALAAAGSSVKVRVKVSNTGRGSARRSRTFVLLSRDARRSNDDIRVARVPTRRLVAGHRTRVRRGVTIPTTVSAGIWRMLVCADGPRRIHETRERNNCRKARRALVVRANQPTPATTPTPAPSPTPAPTPGSGSPKCATEDRPDMAFGDANCDGVDGVAADAVFVSATTGSDGAPGTRDKPRRHLTDAVALAVKTGRSSVLAATGDYAGTLVVAPGVSVYGGYDPVTWKRSKAAETVIEGANDATGSFGVKAQDAVAATTLQLLHVKSPTPATSSGSAYGVDAVHSPGLRLENLIVEAGNATDGENGQNGGDGLPGTNGSDGAPGKCDTAIGGAGGAGGGSPAGDYGGAGGAGGSTGNGASGIAGLVLGGAGGPGGNVGNPGEYGHDGKDGLPGATGASATPPTPGYFGNAGIFWVAATKDGLNGNPGRGGGGGGGGGAQVGPFVWDGGGGGGAGGGGGGAGGLAGKGGAGGGGSFGAVAVGSPGLAIIGSKVVAGKGGAGGAGGKGGAGAWGGAGGSRGTDDCYFPEVGWGGNGGHGGHGGAGGAGAGGAGGPSWGVYSQGGAINVQNSGLWFTGGGAGGAGGDANNAGPKGSGTPSVSY